MNSIAANPRGAATFLHILQERDLTPPDRAVNHLTLAELELAQGRLGAAREHFKQLALVNRHWALADEAYRMLASHHTIGNDELRRWQGLLQRWDAEAAPLADPLPPNAMAIRHDGLNEHLRRYLLGRIGARLHSYQAALGYADDLEKMGNPAGAGSVGVDLAQSIRAHVFAEQGRLEEALQALESAPREVPFPRRGLSWAYVQPQERFLRAELLERLGRPEEALKWYQSIDYWPESVLAGPSHLRQAGIHEQLRQPKQAVEQYRRFVDLWRECDPEFRPLLHSAETTLRRLVGG